MVSVSSMSGALVDIRASAVQPPTTPTATAAQPASSTPRFERSIGLTSYRCIGRWQEVQPSAVPEVTAWRQIIFGIATGGARCRPAARRTALSRHPPLRPRPASGCDPISKSPDNEPARQPAAASRPNPRQISTRSMPPCLPTGVEIGCTKLAGRVNSAGSHWHLS